MITHNLILKESEELKTLLGSNDVAIPTLWKCCWPGLVYMALVITWYFISMRFVVNSEVWFVVGCSFIVFIGSSNARSAYLCLPSDFLKKSKVIAALKKKIIFYIVLHALILVVAGFWCMFLEKVNAVMIFSGVFLLSIVVSIVIFSIDIGRYQLSTFIVVIEQFKGKIKKENLS